MKRKKNTHNSDAPVASNSNDTRESRIMIRKREELRRIMNDAKRNKPR